RWMKVVVPRIRPQEHPRLTGVPDGAIAEPRSECLRRETRDPPLRRHRGERLRDTSQPPRLREEVGDPRHVRRDARPPVHEPERVVCNWPHTTVEVMCEELRLVSRHIDVDGTLAPATLARQAQVERFTHRLVAPALLERVSLEHLEQQPRAPA